MRGGPVARVEPPRAGAAQGPRRAGPPARSVAQRGRHRSAAAEDPRGRRPRPADPGRGPPVAPPSPPKRLGLIDFTAERQRHARFIGRDDVLARLDEWLDGPRSSSWVAVTGGPGVGKSAILSAWLARREQAGAIVPHHFIRRQVADWDQPEVIAASLAAQIEVAFPGLRDPEVKPERRLLELLGRVSRQLDPPNHLVIVVDGLDETRAEPGDNPLPRFLPHVLPAGIRLLCSTRPVHPHLSYLEARSPLRWLDLDDAAWAASNEAVVRGFWAAVAAAYHPPLSARTVDLVIARAD
ncbi:MAG: ATP-binding protein, partial [Deltaproteobacteria bacterium]